MGVVGNVESPHITNDNPISVNLSFSKVGTPVVVTDIEESDINSSLTGGRILPAPSNTTRVPKLLLSR